MGYNSTFSGSLVPSKPIPQEVSERINDADLDVRVAGEGEDYEKGEIVPWSSYMKGYDIVESIVKVQRALLAHGITLSGDIERNGEDADDFERIEVRRGKVYSRAGRIVYGKRELAGVEKVMRYAIRVFRKTDSNYLRLKFMGWAATSQSGDDMDIGQPELVDGKPVMASPGNDRYVFRTYESVKETAYTLKRRNRKKGYSFEITSWEDTL